MVLWNFKIIILFVYLTSNFLYIETGLGVHLDSSPHSGKNVGQETAHTSI